MRQELLLRIRSRLEKMNQTEAGALARAATITPISNANCSIFTTDFS